MGPVGCVPGRLEIGEHRLALPGDLVFAGSDTLLHDLHPLRVVLGLGGRDRREGSEEDAERKQAAWDRGEHGVVSRKCLEGLPWSQRKTRAETLTAHSLRGGPKRPRPVALRAQVPENRLSSRIRETPAAGLCPEDPKVGAMAAWLETHRLPPGRRLRFHRRGFRACCLGPLRLLSHKLAMPQHPSAVAWRASCSEADQLVPLSGSTADILLTHAGSDAETAS